MDQGTPDQGAPDQGTPDQGTPDQGTIRDGMSADEVRELLRKEADRANMKMKSALETARQEAAAAARTELEEAARKASLGEVERAQEEAKAAKAEAESARAQLAELQARSERAEFIATNATGLDRAWRSYLDGQLAAAGEDETADDVLKRVVAEHEQETGGKPRGSLGTGGRPTPPSAGTTINDRIRAAAGR